MAEWFAGYHRYRREIADEQTARQRVLNTFALLAGRFNVR